MTSIRRFLIIVSLAVITLVNFVAALQGYRTGLADTEQLFDAKLAEKAQMLADLSSSSAESGHNTSKVTPVMFQLFDKHNILIRKSPNAPAMPLTDLAPGFSLLNHDGIRWRVYTMDSSRSGAKVIVAESAENRYFIAEGIILRTIVPILLGLPALLLLVWFIVSKALQPLDKLASEVARKKPQDLTPIALADVPTELQPLLDAMNDLLARLSESFDREKRFSGDAAHELRTPLSALKINLFNLKKRMPESDTDMRAMEDSIVRMAHLIEQMLLLYRLSPEQFRSGFTRVDLHEIAQQVIAENYQSIAEKQQDIALEGGSVVLTGNAFAFSTLIKNLIDNANKYTPEHGLIHVTLGDYEDSVILIVEDSGTGIPKHLLDRARERFYRVHGDQNASQVQGCGLGLSIAQHIVDLHSGGMTLQPSGALGGLKVEILMPKVQEPDREH